ncbi:MAG TPA: hypothetical protein VGO07_04905 [Candidatus Saccharimonadales bacterium]|jgi:hypothetical protein|nr:hypothetical protein [Candidatus Saccharimonadales bacterium]
MTEFWFDTATGDQLIGQTAAAMRMEESGLAADLSQAEESSIIDIQILRQQAEILAADLGRKPRKPDYVEAARHGRVARYVTIQKLVGGVTALNREIGFPDYSTWGDDEFINYGISFVETNGIQYLVPDILDIVARRGRGPWGRSAAIQFGSWAAYKEEINTILRLQSEAEITRAEKITGYTNLLAAGQLPQYMNGLSDDELLSIAGKYHVINDCAADLPPSIQRKLILRRAESFIKGIRDHKPKLSQGYIEMIAATHDVFNDIWPPAAVEQFVRPEHIFVSEREIAEVRAYRVADGRKRQPRSHKKAA